MRGCSCRGAAGFAHVSCLAEQAKILSDEAEENSWFGTETIIAANNYAASLRDLHLFEEARSLLRKVIPTAQRVLGEDHYLTLLLKKKCAQSLYRDDGATLDDLREAVTTLEDTERIARRVLSGAHPLTTSLEDDLQDARAARDALQK